LSPHATATCESSTGAPANLLKLISLRGIRIDNCGLSNWLEFSHELVDDSTKKKSFSTRSIEFDLSPTLVDVMKQNGQDILRV
jgi:hypothetical protein